MTISNYKGYVIVIALACAIGISFVGTASAQRGNVVTGRVTGLNNQSIYDCAVELLDEYGAVISFARTDGSGRYFLSGVKSGRFSVRARSMEPEYEEQTISEEIVNFTRSNQDGTTYQSAMENKMIDFNLRLKKGFAGITAALFVQDIPSAAKKLYDKAVTDLSEKKTKEAQAGLRSAIEAFPKYYAALELLGTEYVKMKEYQAAASLLLVATEVNPRGYRSWYGLAYSLNSLDYHDEALKAALKSVELYAGSLDANLLAGAISRTKKNYPDAEKYLLKAKQISKDSDPNVNWQLALLYGQDLKKYTEAANELKAMLKKQPDTRDSEKIKALITKYEEQAKSS